MEIQVLQGEVENEPQDVEPQVVPENGHQVVPEVEPIVDEPEDEPQLPEIEPQVVEPEDEPHIVPEIEPQFVPQNGHQVLPDIELIVLQPEDEHPVVPENGHQDVLEMEPIVVEPEDEPENEPQVDDPENEPQVDEPQNEPQVDEQENEPQVDEPENEPQVDDPENEPQVDEPQNEPQVDEQENEPQVDEPANEPQVDEPQNEPQPQDHPGWKRISEEDWNQRCDKGKFKKEDMNMMIMDYFISQELPLVAEVFHRESGCPVGVDAEDFPHVGTQKIVRELIINRQIDDAILTLNETMSPVFLMVYPRVHFYLEQLKMIDLCRKGDFHAALNFSHKFVRWESFVWGSDSFKEDCRSTLLLMMYGNDEESPVSELLDYSRIFTLPKYVVDNMIKYQGYQRGNYIEKAWKMTLWLQQGLYEEHVTFPYFSHPCYFPVYKA